MPMLVFIKNIDNVVPDNKKGDTVEYKKLVGWSVSANPTTSVPLP